MNDRNERHISRGKGDGLCIAGLIAITAAFLLLFSSSTSPFSPSYGGDSAFYITMGKSVLRGYTPYVKVFDMKGPFIYFLEAIGQLMAPGRTGAFLVQLVFDAATAVLLYLSARLFLSHKWSLTTAVACLAFWSFTLDGGNMPEELCLMPASLCLYLALRTFVNSIENPPAYAFVYGLCCAFNIWVKITNGALIFGAVLYFTCSLLYKKSYKCLLYNALAYLAGLAVITVPLLLWFSARGALADLMQGTFIVPLLYSDGSMFQRTFDAWVRLFIGLIPILVAVGGVLATGLYRQPLGRFTLCCGVVSAVALFPGQNSFIHYFMLAVPYVALDLILALDCIKRREKASVSHRLLTGCLTAYLIILFPMSAFGGAVSLWQLLDGGGWRTSIAALYASYKSVGDMIPADERDDVQAYVGSLAPSWYMVNDIMPHFKYCAYHHISVNKQLAREYEQMLDEDPPLWYVIWEEVDPFEQIVRDALTEKYDLFAQQMTPENRTLSLYRLREDAAA